jgi:cyclase
MLVAGGRLVKGRSFAGHEDAGNPSTTARIYNDQIADEIVLLDIDATRQRRRPDIELLRSVTENCFIPVAFGGGIDSVETAGMALRNGADKVVVNTHAFAEPALVSRLADKFGRQAVVVSIDYRLVGKARMVFCANAVRPSGVELCEAIRRMTDAGAGEFIVTDIDREGRRTGCDLGGIMSAVQETTVPVIGHGGIGSLEDFAAVLDTGAQAAAAGRVFQFADFNLIKVRRYVLQRGIALRRS